MRFNAAAALASALRALVPARKNQPMPLSQVAEMTNQTLGVLERRMAKAKEAGLVDSAAGCKGGYFLRMPAGDITLLMVTKSVGTTAIRSCVQRDNPQRCLGCDADCPFPLMLLGASGMLEAQLSEMTIEELDERCRNGTLFPAKGS